jgi:hypothetical protein
MKTEARFEYSNVLGRRVSANAIDSDSARLATSMRRLRESLNHLQRLVSLLPHDASHLAKTVVL